MDLSSKPCTTTMDMDIYMDMRLKPCTTSSTDAQYYTSSSRPSRSLFIDRLTTLPVELLIRILSLLPTKDAAAAALSSKRMMRVFPWITSLDFDDSPAINHCLGEPHGLESFPIFVAFVDSVLQAYQSQHLTKFRLGVGPLSTYPYRFTDKHKFQDTCESGCFPDLKSTRINAWISFPLTRHGLKELDLRIQVREEGIVQLPKEFFTCQTLEVLKLDVNLGLDQVSFMQSFRLPNLKLLAIVAIVIPDEHGFVTRLVSSCPLLEDFTLKARWYLADFISIFSLSLRRLCFDVWSHNDGSVRRDFVHINAPNLVHLHYADDLASQYSITNMDRLVKADIDIRSNSLEKVFEVSGQLTIDLLRPFTNVQHLSLDGDRLVEDLSYVETKDQLPMFPKLKCLELSCDGFNRWDIVLSAFLNCSPVLETLVFPVCLVSSTDAESQDRDYNDEQIVSERQFCKTGLPVIPSCCRHHLKRIEVINYTGCKREVDLIQFFLRCALVLEELVLYRPWFMKEHHGASESTLRNLPRASASCVIQVLE